MCEIYYIFAEPWKDVLDFSDNMMLELYYQESYGDSISEKNGYYVGKKWLNWQVAAWKEGRQTGDFFQSDIKELYDEGKFPHWWLDRVL